MMQIRGGLARNEENEIRSRVLDDPVSSMLCVAKSSARSRSNSRVRNVIQIRLVEIRIRIDDFWTRACAHRRSFERGKRNV